MNSDFPHKLGSAEEEEDDFDQLNNETFGELSNADDWECEHEKLAESVGPRPPIIPHKVANIIQPSHNNPELQEPLHFLKYPLTDYNSLKTPACFPPPPNINRHSHSNHFLEDEAELAIHESDLVRQLSRLVMENEEEEDRFNKASHHHHHHMASEDSWGMRNGLQPLASFRPFSSPSHKKYTFHNPLEELRHLNTPSSHTPTTPISSSGSGMKAKMTLEELETFLISDDKKKASPETQRNSQQITPWQQPSPSLFQQPPPQLPTSMIPSPQLSKENIVQHLQQNNPQHNQQQQQHYLHSQRLSLQHQQQQLLLQLQQVQQHAIQIQQSLVVSNNPPLNGAQLQQQIVLRQQQQQLFKLQHFLQQSLQQINHHNLMLQQQFRVYSQQQQQQLEITNTENPRKQHPQQIIQFPQHQQQIFQQQQMMLMQQQMGMMPMMTPPQHMLPPPPRQPQRPPDHPFYNGLMEQREKDWLVRIQLLQLHTDNPLVDDYYYTCWSMKNLIRENKKLKKDVDKSRKVEEKRMNDEDDGNKGVKNGADDDDDGDSDDDDDDDEGGMVAKLLISTDSHGESREYVPVQFEGSLGKLRATSIYNPRKVLDVHVSLNADDPKKQDDKKLKEILYKIEKGFDILIQADELHNKISKVDMDMRDNLEIKRFDLIERLTTELLSNGCHVMQQVVNIRKGVVMVTRWMSLLSKEEEQQEVVAKLLIKLNALVKKEWCHEVAPRLYKAISAILNKSNSISRFIEYSVSVRKNARTNNADKFVSSLLKNQLSCSCILLMIVRCEALMGQKSGADKMKAKGLTGSELKKWRDFIEVVGRCLSKREGHIALFKTPTNSEEIFKSHLKRFLEPSIVNSASANLFSQHDRHKSS